MLGAELPFDVRPAPAFGITGIGLVQGSVPSCERTIAVSRFP